MYSADFGNLSEKQIREKLREINKIVSEYDAHKNDAYAYYPEEIDQVRNLYATARKNIGFLLDYVATLTEPDVGVLAVNPRRLKGKERDRK